MIKEPQQKQIPFHFVKKIQESKDIITQITNKRKKIFSPLSAINPPL